jgi:hypothetical protein
MILSNGTTRYCNWCEALAYAIEDHLAAWGVWADAHPRAAAIVTAAEFAACLLIVGIVEGMG